MISPKRYLQVVACAALAAGTLSITCKSAFGNGDEVNTGEGMAHKYINAIDKQGKRIKRLKWRVKREVTVADVNFSEYNEFRYFEKVVTVSFILKHLSCEWIQPYQYTVERQFDEMEMDELFGPAEMASFLLFPREYFSGYMLTGESGGENIFVIYARHNGATSGNPVIKAVVDTNIRQFRSIEIYDNNGDLNFMYEFGCWIPPMHYGFYEYDGVVLPRTVCRFNYGLKNYCWDNIAFEDIELTLKGKVK